jgi:hypothetical protein
MLQRTIRMPLLASWTTAAMGSFRFGAWGSVAVRPPGVAGSHHKMSPSLKVVVLTPRILPKEVTKPSPPAGMISEVMPKKT